MTSGHPRVSNHHERRDERRTPRTESVPFLRLPLDTAEDVADAVLRSLAVDGVAPTSELSLRTKWLPEIQAEELRTGIRQRLVSAIGRDFVRRKASVDSAPSSRNVPKQENLHESSSKGQAKLEANDDSTRNHHAVAVKIEQSDLSEALVPHCESSSSAQVTVAIASAPTLVEKLRLAKANASMSSTTHATPQSVHAMPSNAADVEGSALDSSAMQTGTPNVVRSEVLGDDGTDDDDEDMSFDVYIPAEVRPRDEPPRKAARIDRGGDGSVSSATPQLSQQPHEGSSGAVKDPSKMTKDEYMLQFRRAPRRGEIGITPEQVAEAAALGYVMSGSRNKSGDKYIDRIQRQLHEKHAAHLRLQFLQEGDRRAAEAALDVFSKMVTGAVTPNSEA